MSADVVFKDVFDNIFNISENIVDVIKIITIMGIVFLMCYGLLAKMSKKDISENISDMRD
jgi:arginine exporter protein ArgO